MDPVVDDDDDDVEDELALAPTSAEAEGEGGPVYCRDCEMWLNSPTQWEDHKVGKKHKKNFKRQLAGGQTIGQKNIQKKEKAPAAKNARHAPAPQHEAPAHYQAAGPWPTPCDYSLQWAEKEKRERESRSPFNWRKQGFDSAAPQKNIQKNEKAPAAKNTQDAPALQHEAPTHYQAAWPWPTPDHYGLQWPENLQEDYRQLEFWQQQQAQAQAQQVGYSYYGI